MNRVRIGTRGSRLALKQAALVQSALLQTDRRMETEIVVVHTKGDRIPDKSFGEIGDKGIFASELEQALLEGKIDLAVHSAKDLPMKLEEGLKIVSVLKRADVRDMLVIPRGGRLPREAGRGESANTDIGPFVIGSGSRRRQMLANQIWEQVVCENIRGNVDTRLHKLTQGGYDGIILAKAGLDRLGIHTGVDERYTFVPLCPDVFLPAACQGIIAIEALGDSAFASLGRTINDEETELCFVVEREVLARLAADCSEAIAAWCRQDQGKLELDVMYAGRRQRLTCGIDIDEGLWMACRAAKLVKGTKQI